MERNDAAKDRGRDNGPNPFERFVDAANQRVSRAPFFGVILVALALWAVSKPLWASTTKWELALHTGSAILSLLLLVLLENAGRRAEEASQEKLNVLAEALADLMDHHARDSEELRESVTKLRDAVGLEERH
ncbi:low affinity iron permease family protein [Nocardioides sp. B-3]|uniref:low affinity iron permease family protein n=1 Tax=Nocardioides sp. B-3 TaxID=2895565 RepID=UPI002152D617|nr:low affinity iron permease family protein [Nocardioides sp. B-3]UUZ60878.1 low affinity iron permease family protein [Nocardioides sp. B-3]